jgi:hypothetical protein
MEAVEAYKQAIRLKPDFLTITMNAKREEKTTRFSFDEDEQTTLLGGTYDNS